MYDSVVRDGAGKMHSVARYHRFALVCKCLYLLISAASC